MSIGSLVPSNDLILCHALLLLPSILLSIRVFSNKSVLCIRRPKSFSFTISPSNEYSGLISFRIGLVGFPYSPRDPQESSPIPQCKSINTSALSFLYSSTLTTKLIFKIVLQQEKQGQMTPPIKSILYRNQRDL